MINYIIHSTDNSNYENMIDNFMMNYDIDYKIHKYNNEDNWKEFIKSLNDFKIIIVDSDKDYCNLAKTIREELDDWNTMIIVIDNQSISNKFNIRLLILDFIYKNKEFNKNFNEALRKCIKHITNRPSILKYNYKGIIYNISFRNIIYIEKEQLSKKCLIHTNDKSYPYQGTLNSLLILLDNRFLKVSRSIILNLDQIDSYNTKNNILYFSNGITINSISRDKKKNLIKYIRGLD